jgi:pyridoxine 4-dehydrogenase
VSTAAQPVHAAAGTFHLGGDLIINRLGYGTMQLTGPGVWGDPRPPDEAARVLRRAAELGVNFFDTADLYGPVVAEQLLKKAMSPCPDDLVIATKAGLSRQGPGKWWPIGRPEYLRQQAEMSLCSLGVERIDTRTPKRPRQPCVSTSGRLLTQRRVAASRTSGERDAT